MLDTCSTFNSELTSHLCVVLETRCGRLSIKPVVLNTFMFRNMKTPAVCPKARRARLYDRNECQRQRKSLIVRKSRIQKYDNHVWLRKIFRQTLGKMLSCSDHQWYNKNQAGLSAGNRSCRRLGPKSADCEEISAVGLGFMALTF